MLGDRRRAAVGDLHEHGPPDRVEAACDIAQHPHKRRVRAVLVDQPVELLVEPAEAQRVELGHRLRHLVVDLAQAGDRVGVHAGRREHRAVALEHREDRHLLIEEPGVGRGDLGAGVGPVDHEALGLETPDRLAHGQAGDLELLGERVDHDAIARSVGAAEDALADRLVDAFLFGDDRRARHVVDPRMRARQIRSAGPRSLASVTSHHALWASE